MQLKNYCLPCDQQRYSKISSLQKKWKMAAILNSIIKFQAKGRKRSSEPHTSIITDVLSDTQAS